MFVRMTVPSAAPLPDVATHVLGPAEPRVTGSLGTPVDFFPRRIQQIEKSMGGPIGCIHLVFCARDSHGEIADATVQRNWVRRVLQSFQLSDPLGMLVAHRHGETCIHTHAVIAEVEAHGKKARLPRIEEIVLASAREAREMNLSDIPDETSFLAVHREFPFQALPPTISPAGELREDAEYKSGTRSGTALRRALAQKYNHTCQYCGGASGDSRLEWEHVVPKMQGGPNTIANAVIACHQCNSDKGSLSLDEWFDREQAIAAGNTGASDKRRLLAAARLGGIKRVEEEKYVGTFSGPLRPLKDSVRAQTEPAEAETTSAPKASKISLQGILMLQDVLRTLRSFSSAEQTKAAIPILLKIVETARSLTDTSFERTGAESCRGE